MFTFKLFNSHSVRGIPIKRLCKTDGQSHRELTSKSMWLELTFKWFQSALDFSHLLKFIIYSSILVHDPTRTQVYMKINLHRQLLTIELHNHISSATYLFPPSLVYSANKLHCPLYLFA